MAQAGGGCERQPLPRPTLTAPPPLLQVEAVMEVLLQNNKIRAATHNIMAYRIEAADKPGVFQQVSGSSLPACQPPSPLLCSISVHTETTLE